MKPPGDLHPYDPDPRSRPIQLGIAGGTYVFVQDEQGTILVLPDGPHLHPKVLGGARPAMYAGDLTIEATKIKDLTNLSGTFQFTDAQGLLDVAEALEKLGFEILPGAVRLFSLVDASKPVVLR